MFKWLFRILIFATNGKYQNKEKPLKRQRILGLSYIMSGVKFCWRPQWFSVQVFSKESSWTDLDKLSFHCRWTGVIRYINKKCHQSLLFFDSKTNGPRHEKTCLRGSANNIVADQPAHPRSLISAYVIPFFGKYHM